MNYTFPEKFFWGAAISGYQCEGANFNADWFVWEIKNKLEPARDACRHYDLFEADFALAKELNLNALRFSPEWSRVMPRRDRFFEREIGHYQHVVRSLRSLGLEPFVTLHHFTNPIWFADAGGWLKAKNIDYFLDYVRRMAQALDDVRYWLVFNEPMVYLFQGYLAGKWPPGRQSFPEVMKALDNILKAYCLSYELIKDIYKKNGRPAPQISLAHHLRGFAPCSRLSYIDTALAAWRSKYFNFSLLDGLAKKGYLDFIGVNYYTKEYVASRGIMGRECFKKHHKGHRNALRWNFAPESFAELLLQLKRYRKPIIITENGTAETDNRYYEDYLTAHLKVVAAALAKGVDIRGYFWWSLTDNFEWSDGFKPRFGLYEMNYRNFVRHPRPFAETYGKICSSNTLTV